MSIRKFFSKRTATERDSQSSETPNETVQPDVQGSSTPGHDVSKRKKVQGQSF